ncbi:ligand-gated channel [Methylopila jiangsuensis]|uniref:Ligand-gated channel n=1 Tax=Methylopila jiangsuensis TaxID=586230 RepID=A0A9W6JGX8_9HYPH|nr:TonB-dependent siderophore receptor [Methylopila jiangsuensis]MDR6285194.1 iron complex outermembrane receptor protein [Methylopila jiangsuensis]GLK77416.1 ligand-gated channel [Methylopila jiangsuensis]
MAMKSVWRAGLAAGALAAAVGTAGADPADARRVRIDIAAKAAPQALNELGRAMGLAVVFRENRPITASTKPVKGEMTAREALGRMLSGTGYAYRFVNEGTVSIFNPAADAAPVALEETVELPPLSVAGEGETATGPVNGFVAKRSATASKTDAALIETPQSISVIPRDQMDAQGATTVGEALRYTAGVVAGTAGLQSRRFDPVFLRGFGGFSADASYASYHDGLRWNFPARTAVQIDPFLLERVEVFRGPSSVLYGRAQPGGFVNLVSKRPTDTPVNEVFARVGEHAYLETGVDVGGKVDDAGTLTYRMIALGRLAETQIDYQKDQRILLAPSFTWRPDDQTTLTVQAAYQHDPHTSDAGFVSPRGTILGVPGHGKLSNSFFQGDKNWNRFDRTEAWVSAQFEHEFNDSLTFRSNARYGKIKDTFKSVDFFQLADDNKTLYRTPTISKHDVDNFAIDNQLETKFETGPFSHTTLVGLDYQWMDGPWDYGWSSIDPIDIFDPNNNMSFVKPKPIVRNTNEIEQVGVYAQDQIAFDKWRLWLSGRRDWSNIHTKQTIIATDFVRSDIRAKDAAWTGRAGLVYLFDNGLSPYVSYSTSFEPTLATASDQGPYKPTTGNQWEAGFKYQPTGYNAFITVAAFDIHKENVVSSALVGTDTVYRVDGEVRSRGFEVEGKASLAEGLNLTASYAYTDMKVLETSESTTLKDDDVISHKGKRPVAVPEHTATIWADYAFQPSNALNGLTVGGGVRYISSTFGTASNVWNEPGYIRKPSKVPGFTLVDAAVTYDFGKRNPRLDGFSVTVNAKNLFDKDYIAACNGFGSCTFGEGRMVLATARYRW